MKTVILEVEDSKLEQFMAVMNALKSDIVKKFEVQKNDEDAIDEQYCLEILEKVNRGDLTAFEPISDIDKHMTELKNATA